MNDIHDAAHEPDGLGLRASASAWQLDTHYWFTLLPYYNDINLLIDPGRDNSPKYEVPNFINALRPNSTNFFFIGHMYLFYDPRLVSWNQGLRTRYDDVIVPGKSLLTKCVKESRGDESMTPPWTSWKALVSGSRKKSCVARSCRGALRPWRETAAFAFPGNSLPNAGLNREPRLRCVNSKMSDDKERSVDVKLRGICSLALVVTLVSPCMGEEEQGKPSLPYVVGFTFQNGYTFDSLPPKEALDAFNDGAFNGFGVSYEKLKKGPRPEDLRREIAFLRANTRPGKHIWPVVFIVKMLQFATTTAFMATV